MGCKLCAKVRSAVGMKPQGVNIFAQQNRPQWLIAPSPYQPGQPPAPSYSAYASVGGLLPNVAQQANQVVTVNNQPSTPWFTNADLAGANDYSTRVVLSPVGGPYG